MTTSAPASSRACASASAVVVDGEEAAGVGLLEHVAGERRGVQAVVDARVEVAVEQLRLIGADQHAPLGVAEARAALSLGLEFERAACRACGVVAARAEALLSEVVGQPVRGQRVEDGARRAPSAVGDDAAQR